MDIDSIHLQQSKVLGHCLVWPEHVGERPFPHVGNDVDIKLSVDALTCLSNCVAGSISWHAVANTYYTSSVSHQQLSKTETICKLCNLGFKDIVHQDVHLYFIRHSLITWNIDSHSEIENLAQNLCTQEVMSRLWQQCHQRSMLPGFVHHRLCFFTDLLARMLHCLQQPVKHSSVHQARKFHSLSYHFIGFFCRGAQLNATPTSLLNKNPHPF